MKSTQVDFESTNSFGTLFKDYINAKPELKDFYSYPPSINSFKNYLEDYKNLDRVNLQKELRKQHNGLVLSDKQKENLTLINDQKTFTVTTGHQLNIFAGPLFFVYKILSTIRTCASLTIEYPGYNFVPIFWMATEDHDFEEINYFNLDGEKHTWDTNQNGPVGRFSSNELEQFTSMLPNTKSLFLAYNSENTLAEATRKIVHELFNELGLLILDGDSAYFKCEFKEIIKKEILDCETQNLVENTTKKLENLGYKGQVYPREINLFYLSNQSRERLVKTELGYKTLNGAHHWTKQEIIKEVDTNPENFSPNVILRPIYQQVILPNLSYIGGPGEIAYWLQLKEVFNRYQVTFPIIQPRNFALILNKYTQKKIRKFKIPKEVLFSSWVEWKKNYLSSKFVEYSLKEEINQVNQILNKLEKNLCIIDLSLKRTLEAQKTKINKNLTRLEAKARSGQERKHKEKLEELRRVRAFVFPNNSPQERTLSFINLLENDRGIIKNLYQEFNPFSNKFYILEDE